MWPYAKLAVIVLCQLMVMCYGDTFPNSTCNSNGTKSVIHLLKHRLFCDYDKTLRPVINASNVVNVTVLFEPMFLELEEKTHTMNLHTSFILKWKDAYIKWNPKDYNGTNHLYLQCDGLWLPDIYPYDLGDMSKIDRSFLDDAVCYIDSDGTIRSVAPVKFAARCDTDYTYWPYDKQTCDLRMGSYGYSSQEVNFIFNKTNVYMAYYHARNDWKITNYSTTNEYFKLAHYRKNNTFQNIYLEFKIVKHVSIVHAVFVIPAFVLMLFTLMILWLDSKSIERIILGAVNFACHLLCIQNLHSVLPSNADKGAPHILLFYLDSFALAMFAMIVTAVSRKLRTTKIVAPNWIVFVISFVGKNRTSRFLMFDDGTEFENTKVLVNDNGSLSDQADIEKITSTIASSERPSRHSGNDSWKKLAIIIEWLALISAVLTYFLLFIVLMPKD